MAAFSTVAPGRVGRPKVRRKNQTDGTEIIAAARRGWGPFSGGQLTAIILGIVIAIAFPVGAFAVVSGSNTFVTDATSGVTAKVDEAGQVLAAQTAPNAAFSVMKGIAVDDLNPTQKVFSPGAKAGVVTAIDINQRSLTSSSEATVQLFVSNSSACATATQHIATFTFLSPAPGNLQIPLVFPSGISIRANHWLCENLMFWNGTSVNLALDLNLNGHYIPATACTTTGSTCY
jgi:hypothetical protein